MAYTTINKGSSYFNTLLYTGDMVDGDGSGHTQSITGVGFSPDWVWHKCRSHAQQHMIVDVVRGTSTYNFISSQDNEEEKTSNTNGAIKTIDSDGITLENGTDSSSKANNAGANGRTYVTWNWLADSASASNTSGTLTSTVVANTTAGFSICKYTGATGAQTFGHGLGAVPKMVIIKNLDSTGSGAEHWRVYHNARGAGKYLKLNDTTAETADTGPFSDTTPTSTLVYVGGDDGTCKNGEDHIAYCFAEVKGYSKFGHYKGNGNSTNGPFVYCGFKPAFVMIKEADGADIWVMYDNKRLGYNRSNYTIEADNGGAEGTAVDRFEMLSNGFRVTYNWTPTNTSGQTYIFMAFAEHPFVSSTGTPTTAR